MGTVLNRDPKGRATSLLFIAQDITEEIETGHQFKRIDELFNDTQELLKFGVWEWSVPENRITWSNGLYKILGYDPKLEKDKLQITPEFYLQHVMDADHDKVLYNRKDHLIHHEYDLYYKIHDRNGRVKDVREKAKVFRNDKDELTRVIGSTIDVTEQSQLYRDLAAYKAMKQENEEYLAYGTWEVDARNGSFFWSDGMYRLFGYDPETDTLIDAKDWDGWPPKGENDWAKKKRNEMVESAKKDMEIAKEVGSDLEWHVPTQEKADELIIIFEEAGLEINIIVTPK